MPERGKYLLNLGGTLDHRKNQHPSGKFFWFDLNKAKMTDFYKSAEDHMEDRLNNFRCSIPTMVAIFWIICICSSGLAYSGQTERIFALPEIVRPRQIVAEKGRVYFVDSRNVTVYNLSDGRFLKKIGKLGQGPGEFSSSPSRLSIVGDRLIVKDVVSFEVFSLEGVHKGWIKQPVTIAFYPFLPVGRNFVGFPMLRDDDGSLIAPSGHIWDSNLKLKRKFFGELPAFPPAPPPPGSPQTKGRSDKFLIRDYGDYTVYGDQIYVADSSKGFSISVFDENGILLREIKHSFDAVKVPNSFIDDVVKKWKTLRDWRTHYFYLDPVVPKYFPAIIDFKIDKDRIYALTAAKKNNLYEIIVMDLEGKILGREFRFPLQPNFETPFFNGFKYDIDGDELVWFEYNDIKEVYELHIR